MDDQVFLIIAIIVPFIWYLAIKVEDLISIHTKERYKLKRIESGERSVGNPLTIGFQYYYIVSVGLIIEVSIALLLLFSKFFIYSIITVLIGLLVGLIYERNNF
ncbi:MAG: NADH-quinone oxidoreductase subunit A [Candidatus Rehaiarchaeum fermentans]|nr:NADH-quinone oxidoreductase subunit A [Candidatus Rehaiarchaeum fermentans]MCW1297063.1 NADH-quinone oxidoreductase subunit A [Candidatus Rehaiarchaeum fermentans]MCW1302433.1 NADH-quinone oxidoreductase subunit A [Candidatus Rehaiarchaeum fermentans]